MGNSDYFTPVAAGSQGGVGEPGDEADAGAWAAGLFIIAGQIFSHAKTGYGLSRYKAKINHTSSAGTEGNEPEVSTASATYWEDYVIGGQNGAGSGNVTKEGTWAAGDLLQAVDTGVGIESAGTPGEVLAAALTSLTEKTTAPVGATAYLVVWDATASAWKRISLNNLSKRSQPIITVCLVIL